MNGVEYNRPARVYPGQLPSGEITMIAPPTIPQWPKGVAAWLPFLMPVIGSLGAIGFVFIYHNIWMMVFGIGFAVCSILSGVLMWWGQRRTVKLQYKSNHEKYTKYLEMQAEKLQEITDKQRAFQDVLFPDVGQLVEFAKTRQRVWERRRTDADFLHVSMARGPVKLCCPIRFDAASNPMLDFDPLLLEQASALVEAYEHVDDAPISLSLPSVGSLTVTGDIEEVRALVRSILTQVAVLYAPNDVQLMAYCEGNTVEHWSWMKWLPHCHWGNGLKATSGGTSLCYLADNPVDFAAMFEEQMLPRLKRIGRPDEALQDAPNTLAEPPHLILVLDRLDNPNRIGEIDIADIAGYAQQAGITIIHIADASTQMPSWVQARVCATSAFSYEELRFDGRRVTDGRPEQVDLATAETVARALAPLYINERKSAADLADTVRLADVMGLDVLEAVSPESMWRLDSHEDLLRFPIGVKIDGDPLVSTSKKRPMAAWGHTG